MRTLSVISYKVNDEHCVEKGQSYYMINVWEISQTVERINLRQIRDAWLTLVTEQQLTICDNYVR